MKWNKRLAISLVTLSLLFGSVSSVPARAAQDLDLNGSRSTDKQNIIINETFTLNYCIQPVGSMTQRDKIALSMVLDVSGSMAYPISKDSRISRISALRDASKKITTYFRDADFGDQIALATFDTNGRKVKDLTADYNDIDKTIAALKPDGYTNIDQGMTIGYDSIKLSPHSKKMILVTDGAANFYFDEKTGNTIGNSKKAGQAVSEDADMLAVQKVPVYTVALASDGSDVDLNLLQQVAQKTGGQAFTAKNSTELEKVMQDITAKLNPNINQIVLTQPVPAGFELLAGQKDVTLTNGVLTKTIPDIPGEYGKAYSCAVPVQLKYTGAPAAYTLDKAMVNYKVDKIAKSLDIHDAITLNFISGNGLQGTAALQDGTINPAEPFDWDIRNPLQVKYDMTPIGKNKGRLKNAKLTHLLPAGVTVTGATYQMIGDRQQIAFDLSDYVFESATSVNPAGETKTASLRFPYAGTFNLQPENPNDLTVSFTDETGTSKTVPLTHVLPNAVRVKVHLKDQWNNSYVGDGQGIVTRYGSGGSEQFHVDFGSLPVKDMGFVDASKEAKVTVTFKDGGTQLLDLTPTEPAVVIRDANGTTIPIHDAAYKKGSAAISASGSVPNLPAGTVYPAGSLFQNGYVNRYEVQLDGAGWMTAASISGSGENLSVQVHAVTLAISGTTDEHAGVQANRTISLDSESPGGPLIIGAFLFEEGEYAYTIDPKWYDHHSGLVKDAQGYVNFELVRNQIAEPRSSGRAEDMKFNATEGQISSSEGVAVRLTDRVGLTSDTRANRPQDTTGPETAIDALNVKGADNTDVPIRISATENESFVREIKVKLDGVPVISGTKAAGTLTYSNNNKTAALNFKLSDLQAYRTDIPKRWGWHHIEIEAVNYAGVPTTHDTYFKVNPGPQFRLESDAPSSGAAHQPVTIYIKDQVPPVPASGNQAEVKLKSREYVIGVESPQNPYKPFRAAQLPNLPNLTISQPGISNVYVKLTDEENVVTTQTIQVNIDYDQNRY